MKTIEKIIALFGGIDGLSVSITNEPYMRLVIEHIGDGPRGLPAISVAHYFELNGDLCQDPEMCFEVESTPRGLVMRPYMFQMANPPVYQEVSDDAQGVALARELREFATMWDNNLRDQGFLEGAQRLRSDVRRVPNRFGGRIVSKASHSPGGLVRSTWQLDQRRGVLIGKNARERTDPVETCELGLVLSRI